MSVRLGSRTRGRRSAALLAGIVCCLAGLLVGCGAPATAPGGGSSHALVTATPNATATAAAQPVLVHLDASSSGTIVANSLEMRVETTVINQTGQTIHLTYYTAVNCLPAPPLVFSLVNRDQRMVWQETHTDSCPLPAAHDIATIAAGGSRQWTTTFDLRCLPYSCDPQIKPGTYTLVGSGLLWHEGIISETGETSSPHGFAGAQMLVTFH